MIRDLESRVPGRRDPGHLQAVGDRRAVTPLVGRSAGDDEPDAVQIARFATLLGQDQVAKMDRVKRAAEQPQTHGNENSRRFVVIRTRDHQPSGFPVDKRAEIG